MQSNSNEQSEQNLLSLGSSFRVDVDTISTRLVSSLDRCRILGYPTVYTGISDCLHSVEFTDHVWHRAGVFIIL